MIPVKRNWLNEVTNILTISSISVKEASLSCFVYRAANMADLWWEGPKGAPCCEKKNYTCGARYNCSNNGWFKAICFADWFKTTFLYMPNYWRAETCWLETIFFPVYSRSSQIVQRHRNWFCLPNAIHIYQVYFYDSWNDWLIVWQK